MLKYVKIHAEPCRFRSYFARQVADHRPSTIRKLLSTGPAARMRSPVLPSSAAVPWNSGGTAPKEPLVHGSRGAGSASGSRRGPETWPTPPGRSRPPAAPGNGRLKPPWNLGADKFHRWESRIDWMLAFPVHF